MDVLTLSNVTAVENTLADRIDDLEADYYALCLTYDREQTGRSIHGYSNLKACVGGNITIARTQLGAGMYEEAERSIGRIAIHLDELRTFCQRGK